MKRLQASSWVLANAAADPNPTPTANVPREFLVFAEGANDGDKGTFIFDGQSAASIMANRGKRAEVMIDLEHLSLPRRVTLRPE